MTPDAYVDPAAVQRVAGDLRRLGDTETASRYLARMLDLPGVDSTYRASALFDLAALEDDLDAKASLLDRLLEVQPRHVMARIIRDSLTPAMCDRIRRQPEVLLPVFGYGLNVQLQTSSYCNAKCIMCPYPGSYHDTHPNIMTSDTFDRAVHLLEGMPLRKVCLYNNNEPFLDKRLIEKIETVKSRLRFDHIEISTNGSALTERNIHALVEALQGTRHEIWYSWHGVAKDVYERVMGLDFDKNLARLKNYLRITNGRIKTVFRSITSGRLHVDQQFSTREETEQFFRGLIAEAGLDPASPQFTILPFTFHDRAGSVNLSGSKSEKVASLIGRLKPSCPRLFEWLHILDDGSLVLCCMDYHKETATVDVRNFDRLEDLLTAEPVARLRNMALGRIPSPEDFICRRCTSPGG
jgi:hypothetical protein